jgi:hypothetical protein
VSEAAMAVHANDLWSLVLDRQYVDPGELADAVRAQAEVPALDFRTRLLIRDSVEALRTYWGEGRLNEWLKRCPNRGRIEAIRREELGKPGFPFLREQVMEPTRAATLREFFEELGQQLHRPVRIAVGGSGALILTDYLSRRTQDIDVVDELPPEIRSLHKVLDQLTQRYRLQIAHFQSHYLPSGWEQRLHSLEPFGRLQVFLVDVHDVLLSKLFSGREKDRDDLRALAPQLDKETITRRLKATTAAWQKEPALLKHAQDNWHILYGESLPQ